MLILADTNVWIDHFQRKSRALAEHLVEGEILLHPLVLGELALGQYRDRDLIFGFLREMPLAKEVEHLEVITLIDQRKLFGLGVGLVDVLLLASALITPDCLLWTGDKRLANIAQQMGVAY